MLYTCLPEVLSDSN